MITEPKPLEVPLPTPEDLPPLENGDHLDQPTFHARYQAMPEHVRAELIGGIVFMASPVRRRHMRHDQLVSRWLDEYEERTPGVEALGAGTVVLGLDSEPEPDAILRVLPDFGGRTRDEEDYVTGAPELVVEIAASTEAIDVSRKKADYERAGIDEYVIVLLRRQGILWFVLHDGRYQPLQPDEDGIFRSRVFPGLWLDPAALLRQDRHRLLEVLRAGTATPEHASFVAELEARKA